MRKRLSLIILTLVLALSLTACGGKPELVTRQIFAMDTVMDFAVYGGDTEGFLAAATDEIHRLEDLLSRTKEESDVSRINGGGTITVSSETADLLKSALYYSDLTGGAFDMTIAPLVTAWGIHTEDPHVLTQPEIDTLLPLVGSEHVRIEDQAVTLDEGCSVDLGGITKGYASGRLAALFAQYEITGGWVSLGGNVYTYGSKDGENPWLVSIRDPSEPAGAAVMLTLSDQFAVTSGGYQRYFTAGDGTVYQHILDPATGAPARSDLLSVTIIGTDGTMADALSTALYVMGETESCDFWRAHRDDFDMILITGDARILYTPRLEGTLTLEEGGRYEAQPVS